MTTDGEDDAFERTVDGYDTLADHPDRIPWRAGDYQRYYVWPSVRPLLPDVVGSHVLDAGCGIGDYVAWFLDEGATVTGVDASDRALERARDRFGDRRRAHRDRIPYRRLRGTETTRGVRNPRTGAIRDCDGAAGPALCPGSSPGPGRAVVPCSPVRPRR